ncbi:uncharacterized protein BO95DRAFT_484408 [Aspergillus brunneoviolaceus CBS 621.78]|uniref:Uncharacterized protein n=1 Tax=Aspergillus brunneoviolaceus CBS 621.78 TaxID=1450534 RepID=A0ACD1G0W4_9EURO|nr:hypothetical protein BO95DRAFT_484408 [Aspergillus brunneoviolaceus CBS 621.78]RAH42842.1 hypothetical protein BO95DRAFT_484408 [Aspergillus brunneoviolaceus CBS 621.78]
MSRLPYPNYHTLHAKSFPTLNIIKLLFHSAATVDHWTALGNAQFKHLSLADRDRELVIMLTTAKFQSTYEWTHHVPVAGVTRAQQYALAASSKQFSYFIYGKHSPEAGFNPRDLALLTFVETII